jgi:hypothetical protein
MMERIEIRQNELTKHCVNSNGHYNCILRMSSDMEAENRFEDKLYITSNDLA